jgi:integrase
MSDYLEKRRQLYYAVLTVPKALQPTLGLRFVKSTATGDRRKAKLIASRLVAAWKLRIEDARGNDVRSETIQFRADMAKAEEIEDRTLFKAVLARYGETPQSFALLPQTDERKRDMVDDYLYELEQVFKLPDSASLDDAVAIDAERLESPQALASVMPVDHVDGSARTPHNIYYANWQAQLTVTPRTIEQYSKDVRLFIEQFPVIEEVGNKAVRLWMDALSAKGVTNNTQSRILKACRHYWGYVSRDQINGLVEDPFHQVILADKAKQKTPRAVFQPHEIVALWAMARDRRDAVLADLIILGAYTGARIDALCRLQVKDVAADVLNIIDAKAIAGLRKLPIHHQIKPVIKRLTENASDAYLLPGLSLDKFGDRSNKMSGRFSKLKTKAGHGRLKVFNSLRHTLVAAMANAGVLQFLIADIVGHEKQGIAGVYAQATSMDVKREAIEKISYPFPELV